MPRFFAKLRSFKFVTSARRHNAASAPETHAKNAWEWRCLSACIFAEAAGACAVMALERIPADIRAAGGVSRMSDPKMIQGIQEAVSIPYGTPNSFASLKSSSSRMEEIFAIALFIIRIWRTACTTSPVPGSPFVRIIEAPSFILRSASPKVNFAAGGVATPADAALMMQLGAEGVFVGSGIFKSGNPQKRADAIVKAVTNYQDAALIAELSKDLGEAMVGINEDEIELLMAERGK